MTLRRRSRILLASFALTAPLMLGGCSATYCEEPAGDSLEALVKGLLCLGFGFVGGPPAAERPVASFEVRPSTIPSGGVVTLDATGSRGGFQRPVALYKWDVDGDYRVFAGGGRQFDYEFTDFAGTAVSQVRLFRRDPAFVTPPGEIIDDGVTETRVIGLHITDVAFEETSDVGRVRITGDPVPPGANPPVAIFRISPPRPSVGQNVILDGGASEGAATYAWDLDGNGSFETGPIESPVVTHVFQTSGINVVRLQVTNAQGESASAPKEIFVAPAGERRSASASATRRAPRAGGRKFSARLARVRFPSELGAGRPTGRTVAFGPLRAGGGSWRDRARTATWQRSAARPGGPGSICRSSPRARRLRVRGLALARFARGAGTACLRLRLTARRGKPVASGRMTAIGGRATPASSPVEDASASGSGAAARSSREV